MPKLTAVSFVVVQGHPEPSRPDRPREVSAFHTHGFPFQESGENCNRLRL